MHPLNHHYARHVLSKFVSLPERTTVNLCEDAPELDAVRAAYPHALLLHTKGLSRQSPGAREVSRSNKHAHQRRTQEGGGSANGRERAADSSLIFFKS